MATFHSAHSRGSKHFRMFIIYSQNYAGRKQKSYEVMGIEWFAALYTENIRLELDGGQAEDC
jgi:hypothetical protein